MALITANSSVRKNVRRFRVGFMASFSLPCWSRFECRYVQTPMLNPTKAHENLISPYKTRHPAKTYKSITPVQHPMEDKKDHSFCCTGTPASLLGRVPRGSGSWHC